jgi:hypothetical protein
MQTFLVKKSAGADQTCAVAQLFSPRQIAGLRLSSNRPLIAMPLTGAYDDVGVKKKKQQNLPSLRDCPSDKVSETL